MNEQKQHLLRALAKGVRYDGRALTEFRPLKVELDISRSAEGSTRVLLGETDLFVGVKLGIETPYPDTPEDGNFMVNAELRPMSNPEFEVGPPGNQAIELARVVDRGIREAHAIDTAKLCIKKGEKVWSVMVDVCTVNDDGNLLDASGIGAIIAIKNTFFPKLKEDNTVDYEEKTKNKLPLQKEPIPITVYKVGSYFIVDPLPVEEKLSDARLTAAITEEGIVCALQKGGESQLTTDDISKMLDISIDKAQEIRKKLKL
ncbi:exosome complex protein Rrp42 [Candidatus Woesearchaeota archaeon]|nr:exosome complex protein Rrp42 [Candidatus Woesearchaeota archaeon]